MFYIKLIKGKMNKLTIFLISISVMILSCDTNPTASLERDFSFLGTWELYGYVDYYGSDSPNNDIIGNLYMDINKTETTVYLNAESHPDLDNSGIENPKCFFKFEYTSTLKNGELTLEEKETSYAFSANLVLLNKQLKFIRERNTTMLFKKSIDTISDFQPECIFENRGYQNYGNWSRD